MKNKFIPSQKTKNSLLVQKIRRRINEGKTKHLLDTESYVSEPPENSINDVFAINNLHDSLDSDDNVIITFATEQ